MGWVVLSIVVLVLSGVASHSLMESWRCRWRGHDWFPGNSVMEFLVVEDICLRHCGSKRVRLPYGECLNMHPIAEHYNAAGDLIEHPTCPGPM